MLQYFTDTDSTSLQFVIYQTQSVPFQNAKLEI